MKRFVMESRLVGTVIASANDRRGEDSSASSSVNNKWPSLVSMI